MRNVDYLIIHARLVTMEGPGIGYVPDGAVAVKGSVIQDVGSTRQLLARYRGQRVIDVQGDIVLPGFVDAHCHTSLGLLRGVAQDMDHWMQLGLWPWTQQLHEDRVAAGSLVQIIEAVKAGTTTFCDFNRNMADLIPDYQKIGARLRAAEMIHSLPADLGAVAPGSLYPLNDTLGGEGLQRNMELFDTWNDRLGGRITVMFGPQGPDFVGRELLQDVFSEAGKRKAMVHMHVAQGTREIEQMKLRWKRRSPQYLQELNLLGPQLLAVHLTEATAAEVRMLADAGTTMAYCAGSIGIIDGLIPPVAEFVEAGGWAGLGSDQVPGNNCCSMWNEMKFTALLQKVKFKDPKVFPAWKVLRMATVEGAQAVGLGASVGSIAPGKYADLQGIDSHAPTLCPILEQPIRNIAPNLVYSARGSEVRWVMIHGHMVVEDGRILTVDERHAVERAGRLAVKAAQGASPQLAEHPLKALTESGYL